MRSGVLNLLYSYDYRAFENYLIPLNAWEDQKQNFLERSALSEFENWDNLEKGLKKSLKKQYKITNQNIKNKEFKYAGKNEQLVADACKRLIENSIICWNYAYLTNLIASADSKEQKIVY